MARPTKAKIFKYCFKSEMYIKPRSIIEVM